MSAAIDTRPTLAELETAVVACERARAAYAAAVTAIALERSAAYERVARGEVVESDAFLRLARREVEAGVPLTSTQDRVRGLLARGVRAGAHRGRAAATAQLGVLARAERALDEVEWMPSNEALLALAREAQQAGDAEQWLLAQHALDGDRVARAKCATAIALAVLAALGQRS